eukprot:352586-Chlamydomonas_euryale.AAC.2
MGHVLRMGEDRLPRQFFDCSMSSSAAEDGRVEQRELRPGHRNIEDSFLGGPALQSGPAIRKVPKSGGNTFQDIFKSPGHTKLIPCPAIRVASVERAVDRQARRYQKKLVPLELSRPNRLGRMTRSSARSGRSG